MGVARERVRAPGCAARPLFPWRRALRRGAELSPQASYVGLRPLSPTPVLGGRLGPGASRSPDAQTDPPVGRRGRALRNEWVGTWPLPAKAPARLPDAVLRDGTQLGSPPAPAGPPPTGAAGAAAPGGRGAARNITAFPAPPDEKPSCTPFSLSFVP